MGTSASSFEWLKTLVIAMNKEKGEPRADGYYCPRCMNRGIIHVIQFDELYGEYKIFAKFCNCRQERQTHQEMRKSGLSQNVLNKYTFDSYEVTEDWQGKIKQVAESYVKAEGQPWFFIGGETGAGKSHICTAIVSELLKQGKSASYMMWRDDSTVLKQSNISEPEAYREKMNRYKSVDILYIDDLFKAGRDREGNIAVTAADVNIAFEIINARYNNNLQTIISTELFIQDIANIDNAICGRIIEKTNRKYLLLIKQDDNRNYRLKKSPKV